MIYLDYLKPKSTWVEDTYGTSFLYFVMYMVWIDRIYSFLKRYHCCFKVMMVLIIVGYLELRQCFTFRQTLLRSSDGLVVEHPNRTWLITKRRPPPHIRRFKSGLQSRQRRQRSVERDTTTPIARGITSSW